MSGRSARNSRDEFGNSSPGSDSGKGTDLASDGLSDGAHSYHYSVDNVTVEAGVWVVRYPNLVNRFRSRPQWLETIDRINQILDDESQSGRNPWLLRARIDSLYDASCRDYVHFHHGRFQKERCDVRENLEAIRDAAGKPERRTIDLLGAVFTMKAADNTASSGNCPMANRHCSESFKFNLILELLAKFEEEGES
jgi:hypothetical protein